MDSLMNKINLFCNASSAEMYNSKSITLGWIEEPPQSLNSLVNLVSNGVIPLIK